MPILSKIMLFDHFSDMIFQKAWFCRWI